MRLLFVALVVGVAFCAGCRPSATPPPDATVIYVTGSDKAAGVEWSYAFVSDKASGNLLYAAVVYGRSVLAGQRPSRDAVPVDGKIVAIPSTDGSLFVIDSTLNCHRAPMTPEAVRELVREKAAGTLYAGAVWARLQPFLRLYQSSE